MTGDTVTGSATERTFSYGPGAILTPANAVTLLRLAFAPVAFVMMWRDPDQSSWPLVGLWFVLSASDLLDGTLARRYGTTRSGAFLDPLADKVLAIGGVGIMCWTGHFPWAALVLIVVREIAISIFRAAYVRRGLAVPASKLAKWKTFLQLGAVGWVTLPLTTDMGWLANLTLWLGVGVGLVSGVQYLVAGSRGATSMAR
jgi:CDP-diacylglycerol--glycerol-3-phosphate 3-phosphatidyltransferase